MEPSSDRGNYGTPSPRPASATTSIDTHTISTTTEDSGSPLVCGEGDREVAASYGSVRLLEEAGQGG